jgi:crescentin
MAKLADIFRLEMQEAEDENVIVPMPMTPQLRGKRTDDDADGAVNDDRAGGGDDALVGAGVQIGRESEALHLLVMNTRRKIEELEQIRQAFDQMAVPLSAAMRALDQERLLSKNLASQLDEKTSGYDKLRDELQRAENKIRRYESETEDLQSALDQAREAGRALERRQNELAEEIKRRGGQINELECRVEQEMAQRHSLTENCRTLQEQLARAEKRVVELQGKLTTADEKCELLDDDRGSLRDSLDQAMNEIARLNRGLVESESTAATARADLGKVEASYAEMCNERSRLAAALHELGEQRQAESQMLNERIAALQSRAVAAERMVADTRQRLIARTEEVRAFVSKAAEATVARDAAERQLAELEVLQGRRAGQNGEPERPRKDLAEVLGALNVKSREMSLAGAAEKLAALADRNGHLAADSRATRGNFDRRSEDPAFEGDPAKYAEINSAPDASRKGDARLEDEIAGLVLALRDADNAEIARTAIPTEEMNEARLTQEEERLVREIEARALRSATSRNGNALPESLFTSRPRRVTDEAAVGRKSSAA